MRHDLVLAAPRPRARLNARVGFVALAGLVAAGVMLWLAGDVRFATGFLATFAALCSLVLLLPRSGPVDLVVEPERDLALLASAIEPAADAMAITDRSGRLVAANSRYRELFGESPAPQRLDVAGSEADRLDAAARFAWRDGAAATALHVTEVGALDVAVTRAGARADHLVWRIAPPPPSPGLAAARELVTGAAGTALAAEKIGAALVNGDGRLLAASPALTSRAASNETEFARLLSQGEDARLRYAADGADAAPLRVLQIPTETGEPTAPSLFLLIEELEVIAGAGSAANLQALLQILPLGLALADSEGRLLFFNDAFRAAAGIESGAKPVFPSDLVVKEDKAAVADAVRRYARGGSLRHAPKASLSSDIAVHLKSQPAEPVALTIAGTRGLGDAAVLLLLKDNSEEVRLKAQVAQATKMQAVGQLAGGVAHDFNNILTAIIGHCDLMMMRHTPGDSDYDDIQQIRNNGNRAAALTRQLLAFSRQQTLRPQVLQLPDVISEVSHLLKRLLGEEVRLVVKHGRNLGAVRADPGQLEQVIVNLAVNARDAMASAHGVGTLTIQTYPVTADQVRDLGSEILPVAAYTAISVTDTGAGIPAALLGKIFEPFFTTKEVGKGTGLGLSTVYGIVKQSGGFIFADSQLDVGTTFTIYLPVHREEARAERAKPAVPPPTELWGRGIVLLVEDEAMVRAVAERALTRQGYTVVTASNGEEALEILDRGEIVDLLISDVVMPMMDGPAMVREARRSRPDLPVLFMSGYAEEQLRRSISIENVSFLPKPFSVQQLAEAARDTLTSRSPL
jgi:two-component system cell cycle sensor histidine kinase/response regulator CckA